MVLKFRQLMEMRMNGDIVLVGKVIVDNTPTIGSITWSTAGTYGHVAWVSNVMGDQIEIEEYNYGYTELYNKRIIKANTMTGFIHFKDLDGGSVRIVNPQLQQAELIILRPSLYQN